MTNVTEATNTVNEAQVANGHPCGCDNCNQQKEKTLSEMLDEAINNAKSNLAKNEKRRASIQEHLDIVQNLKTELDSHPYPEVIITGFKFLVELALN